MNITTIKGDMDDAPWLRNDTSQATSLGQEVMLYVPQKETVSDIGILLKVLESKTWSCAPHLRFAVMTEGMGLKRYGGRCYVA